MSLDNEPTKIPNIDKQNPIEISGSLEGLLPKTLRQSLGAIGISGAATEELLTHAEKIVDPNKQIIAYVGIALLAGEWTSSFGKKGEEPEHSTIKELSTDEIPTIKANQFMKRLLEGEAPKGLTQKQTEDFIVELMQVYPKIVRASSASDLTDQLLLHLRGKQDKEIVAELKLYVSRSAITAQRYNVVKHFHERGYPPERILTLLETFLRQSTN